MATRQYAIDIFKGIAITAVVAIHTLGSFSNINLPWIIINQSLRFCVPLFVFISGYTLAVKYHSQAFTALGFYKRRAFKILPIYLLWTVIILITIFVTPEWSGFAAQYPWYEWILVGRAEYHLYFIPMIFQLYLLFPLLLKAVQRYWYLLVGITLIATAYMINDHTFFKNDQQQYVFFASWLIYFVWGIIVAVHHKVLMDKHKHFYVGTLIFAISALIWSIYDAASLYKKGIDIIITTRFTRWPVYIYALSLSTLSIKYMPNIKNIPLFSFIGKHSFLIYLMHTLVLRLIMAIIDHQLSLPYIFFVSGMIILGVIGSLKLQQN